VVVVVVVVAVVVVVGVVVAVVVKWAVQYSSFALRQYANRPRLLARANALLSLFHGLHCLLAVLLLEGTTSSVVVVVVIVAVCFLRSWTAGDDDAAV
jgi:hypothetical protein